jgi:hypothetical protein
MTPEDPNNAQAAEETGRSILVYLDHNIVDDLTKGLLSFKNSPQVLWVYSDEHFREIKRSGSTRFLDALARIKAQRLELEMNEQFRITGRMRLSEYADPHALYEAWSKANAETELSDDHFLGILSRLFGAANTDQLKAMPEVLEREVSTLLGTAGLADALRDKIAEVACDTMQDTISLLTAEDHRLQSLRETLGTHRGRASNVAKRNNPLQDLWATISPGMPGVTADQFFGFEPIAKGEDVDLPLFLGMVGCYMVLNMIGFSPDEKLARVERMPAIASDANHVAYGAYCDAVLSADRRLCTKARAIYKYRNISTEVYRLARTPLDTE